MYVLLYQLYVAQLQSTGDYNQLSYDFDSQQLLLLCYSLFMIFEDIRSYLWFDYHFD